MVKVVARASGGPSCASTFDRFCARMTASCLHRLRAVGPQLTFGSVAASQQGATPLRPGRKGDNMRIFSELPFTPACRDPANVESPEPPTKVASRGAERKAAHRRPHQHPPAELLQRPARRWISGSWLRAGGLCCDGLT